MGIWDDMEDCRIGIDWSDDMEERPKKKKEPRPELPEARAIRNRERHITRRAMSEQKLYEVMDWHLEDGCSYHIMSGGDVDSLSYLRAIVKQQPIRYCLLSTWCMAMTDAEEIGGWVDRGLIKRLDLYVGEIFMGNYLDVYEYMRDEVIPKVNGRICAVANHSKVMVGFGDRFDFVVSSSANMNTNPRIESTIITVDTEVARFYKDFFDSLKAYNKGYESWEPWREEDGESQGRDRCKGCSHNDNER